MMSFGWTTACLGTSKLSLLSLALLIVVMSYVASFDRYQTNQIYAGKTQLMAETQLKPLQSALNSLAASHQWMQSHG
ncbi:MAG: hypothetical protein AAF387_03315 [Pseudomonadota bacterium]